MARAREPKRIAGERRRRRAVAAVLGERRLRALGARIEALLEREGKAKQAFRTLKIRLLEGVPG